MIHEDKACKNFLYFYCLFKCSYNILQGKESCFLRSSSILKYTQTIILGTFHGDNGFYQFTLMSLRYGPVFLRRHEFEIRHKVFVFSLALLHMIDTCSRKLTPNQGY